MNQMVTKHNINAVHEKELPVLLKSLSLLEPINNGLITCNFCNKKITLENLNCIYPKNGEIKFCCDSIECYRKSVADSKESGNNL